MNALSRHADGRYRLGTRLTLDGRQRRRVYRLLASAPKASETILGGRQSVTLTTLAATGPVAIKHYARGGLIRHVSRRTYLNVPRTRGEKEFFWLETVRRIGIQAPRPIAFVAEGRLWGRCWLITEAISSPRSLIQLPRSVDQEAIFRQVQDQIGTLLRHNIWHRDLHPGNILVDQDHRVYVIDFDKARYLNNRRLLEWCYTRRWRRAVVKYGLPADLAGIMTSLEQKVERQNATYP